jgi:hypothetical protein
MTVVYNVIHPLPLIPTSFALLYWEELLALLNSKPKECLQISESVRKTEKT